MIQFRALKVQKTDRKRVPGHCDIFDFCSIVQEIQVHLVGPAIGFLVSASSLKDSGTFWGYKLSMWESEGPEALAALGVLLIWGPVPGS